MQTDSGGMFFVRPYLYDFLKELSIYYEIIIFTASTKEYADLIINILDPTKEFFSHRLYRESTTAINNEITKNLNLVNRDLKKVVFIDNMISNFKLQPDNGIHIKTWTNDIWDKQLLYLLKFLKKIASEEVDDVRFHIKVLKEKTIIGYSNNYKNEINHNYFNSKIINNINIIREPDYELSCFNY